MRMLKGNKSIWRMVKPGTLNTSNDSLREKLSLVTVRPSVIGETFHVFKHIHSGEVICLAALDTFAKNAARVKNEFFEKGSTHVTRVELRPFVINEPYVERAWYVNANLLYCYGARQGRGRRILPAELTTLRGSKRIKGVHSVDYHVVPACMGIGTLRDLATRSANPIEQGRNYYSYRVLLDSKQTQLLVSCVADRANMELYVRTLIRDTLGVDGFTDEFKAELREAGCRFETIVPMSKSDIPIGHLCFSSDLTEMFYIRCKPTARYNVSGEGLYQAMNPKRRFSEFAVPKLKDVTY